MPKFVADSSQTTGLKWQTPSTTGASFTLLNSGGTNLTGATSVTVSGISGQDKLLVFLEDASSANAVANILVRINNDSGTNYDWFGLQNTTAASYSASNDVGGSRTLNGSEIYLGSLSNTTSSNVCGFVRIEGCNSSGNKGFISTGGGRASGSTGNFSYWLGGVWKNSATVSSITIISNDGNLDNGKVYVYGSAS